MRRSKMALLAGISGLALLAGNFPSHAADIPLKAPRLAPAVWTWWLDGGASHVGGDPFVLGLNNPPFDLMPKSWGWQGAAGVDYRFGGSPWHLSAQVRYTDNGANSGGNSPIATFTSGVATGTNSAERKEHNWAADFMVGRDLGLGVPTQAKIGVRVAEIWGRTTGQAQWPLAPSGTQTRSYDQSNRFIGWGPRAAIEGSVPLRSGAWSFEYNAGIAGLWGKRSVDQTVAVSGTFGGAAVVCTTGCPIAGSDSNTAFIWNADVQAGVAYAINRNAKLALSYRYEAYWNALRGYDANGNATNLSRFYHGPTVRLTVAY